MIMESGDWLIGGDLEVVDRIRWHDGLDQYRLTPNKLRKRFQQLQVQISIVLSLRLHSSPLVDRRMRCLLFSYEIPFTMVIHY